jgi:hypothetical protein
MFFPVAKVRDKANQNNLINQAKVEGLIEPNASFDCSYIDMIKTF